MSEWKDALMVGGLMLGALLLGGSFGGVYPVWVALPAAGLLCASLAYMLLAGSRDNEEDMND